MCGIYEVCVGFMRHTQILCYNECYHVIMNTELDAKSSEVANLLQ